MPCVCHREPHLVTLILSNQGTKIRERFSDLTATLKTEDASKLKLSKYGHSAFHHLCWVPVMIGVGCANLSPLGNSDAHGAHGVRSLFNVTHKLAFASTVVSGEGE